MTSLAPPLRPGMPPGAATLPMPGMPQPGAPLQSMGGPPQPGMPMPGSSTLPMPGGMPGGQMPMPGLAPPSAPTPMLGGPPGGDPVRSTGLPMAPQRAPVSAAPTGPSALGLGGPLAARGASQGVGFGGKSPGARPPMPQQRSPGGMPQMGRAF